MGIDEQKEEREVLDSIFPDEITGPSLYNSPDFMAIILTESLQTFRTHHTGYQ
jgi:hypothetical protein